MAVFRVEKTRDFTVMSNHHLRNTKLSLKAKGLMSLILSLPEDWDYTLKGLTYICKDGEDSVAKALKELEKEGYLTRQRLRLPNGRLVSVEYTIHEQPKNPDIERNPPKRENPEQAFPKQDLPEQEKQAQLNIYKLNTEKSNKDKSTDKKDNIEYDILVERYGADKLDALVDLMLEVVVSDHPYCVISSEKLPRDLVRSRILKIDSSHIEFVLGELNETTSKVGNTRAYVLAALFNAPAIWIITTNLRSITTIRYDGAASALV